MPDQDTQTPSPRSPRRPTPRNVEITDRERQALDLRKAGGSFDAIARQLKFADRSGARKAVSRALEGVLSEAVGELRALDGERLDRLLLAVWQQAIAGDLKAVDRALRILDQRARLHGLNVPVKAELDVQVTERTATDAALDELVAEMERRAKAQRAVTAPEDV